MKKTHLLWLLGLVLGGVLIIAGCSDDDNGDNSIIQPGDPNAPEYEMFSDQFEGVHEMSGHMIELSFEMLDSIMSQGAARSSALSVDEQYSFTWVAGLGAWVCTFSDTNSYDSMTFEIVDTVRFYHGVSTVQYPDEDSVSQLSHNIWLEVGSYGSDSSGGDGYMIYTLDRPNMGDTLVLDGSGNLSGYFEYDDINEGDTTSCSGNMSFGIGLNNLRFYLDFLHDNEGELNCPFSGSLTYAGAMNVVCTGAEPGSLSGSWNVTQTFNDGDITIVISNGTNNWTVHGDCETGAPIESPEFDSLFVDNLFDGPDMFMQSVQVLDLTGMLIDYIGGSGTARFHPLAGQSAEDGLEITNIESYSYVNGWHIFEFDAISVEEFESDTVFITGIDSIQLRDASGAVQNPTDFSALEEIWERIHGSWEHNSGEESGAVHHRIDFDIAQFDPTIFVVSGNTNDTNYWYEEDYELGYCEAMVANSQALSGLTVNMTDGGECPTAGSMTNTTVIDATCFSEGMEYYAVHGTWIVTMSVNLDGSLAITYNGPVIDWSTTVTCGPVVTASKYHLGW